MRQWSISAHNTVRRCQRQFLYRSGHNWFRIRLMALSGRSIAEQKFVHRKNGQTYRVYDWTINTCGGVLPDHIKDLSPDSPAIMYRYPNDNPDKSGDKTGDNADSKDLYGAAALCYRTFQNDSPEVRRFHHRSKTQKLAIGSTSTIRRESFATLAGHFGCVVQSNRYLPRLCTGTWRSVRSWKTSSEWQCWLGPLLIGLRGYRSSTGLGDFFLRPLASSADEEGARYDDDCFSDVDDEAKIVAIARSC
jgi:hypothetical protein